MDHKSWQKAETRVGSWGWHNLLAGISSAKFKTPYKEDDNWGARKKIMLHLLNSLAPTPIMFVCWFNEKISNLIKMCLWHRASYFIDNSTSQEEKNFYMNRGCLNLKWTCVGSFKKISFKICGGFFFKRATLEGATDGKIVQ